MRAITSVRITIKVVQHEQASIEDLQSAQFPQEVRPRTYHYDPVVIERSLSDEGWGTIPAELRLDLVSQLIDGLRRADAERERREWEEQHR